MKSKSLCSKEKPLSTGKMIYETYNLSSATCCSISLVRPEIEIGTV
jgi:hypothetical protein